MGTHVKTRAPKAAKSSPTGGFGRKFLLLIVVAGLIAWGITSIGH